MHGIHHSIVKEETGSNWGTIFTWPDTLHGTIRLNVPQQEITIGVPAWQDPEELTIGRIMAMPFTLERNWEMADGSVPAREALPVPKTVLLS